MVRMTPASRTVPIQRTEAVTITGECRFIRRFEIRIHAMAANIESTTSRSPSTVACVVQEALLLDSAINPAPTVDARRASQPPKCNRSPENTMAATARSMGSVPTIKEACETVVSESPLNCTKNSTGTPSIDAANTQPEFTPFKMTIKENDRHQTCARECHPKPDHCRDRHLAERDLAEEKSCSPQASSRCQSEDGDDTTVRLEHCFPLVGQALRSIGQVRNLIRLQCRLLGGPEVGSRRDTAPKAETTSYGQAFRRAVDWQPKGRLGYAVCENALKALDFGNGLLSVHVC